MAFVRYRSPDDSTFTAFDASRFRVDHGTFLLRLAPLRERIGEKLEEQAGWNLEVLKLVQENRRLADCLEWLDTLPEGDEVVIAPELKHEPAIDLVANRLIGDGEFERAYCPACEAEYRPEVLIRVPWSFEEDGVTLRGRRITCAQGHTLHVAMDEIDAIDLESPDE